MPVRQIKGFLLLLAVSLLFSGCSRNYPIEGQVIDAETRKPVEGAVVAINWIRYKWTLPGLPTQKDRFGTTECITGSQGRFTVPKYPFGSHFMGIYKEGYVCWSSEAAYDPQGQTYEQKYAQRIWHRVKDGMVIELIPIKGKDFPVLEHARFVNNVAEQVESLQFTLATSDEFDMEYPRLKKQRNSK
ncbi:MAG: hypothetical protein M0036_26770 [Desulfobacteraceae bacterium]|nr:hypothetical protein [Desulfobacteraceae bacterium]